MFSSVSLFLYGLLHQLPTIQIYGILKQCQLSQIKSSLSKATYTMSVLFLILIYVWTKQHIIFMVLIFLHVKLLSIIVVSGQPRITAIFAFNYAIGFAGITCILVHTCLNEGTYIRSFYTVTDAFVHSSFFKVKLSSVNFAHQYQMSSTIFMANWWLNIPKRPNGGMYDVRIEYVV